MNLPNNLGFIASFVFLVISAFFSFAEACLIACDERKILRDAERQNKKAIRVIKILKDKNTLISNILFCATLSDVFLSSIFTMETTKHFGAQYVVISSFLATAVILIFGQVLPKAFALISPEKSSKAISFFMFYSIKILNPVTFLIQKIVNFTFFTCRIKSKDETPSLIRDIQDLISLHKNEHHNKNNFETNSYNMIRGVAMIENMRVSQIMVHRKNIEMINIKDKTIDEIISAVIATNHSRIPVCDGEIDDIIGIIYKKDLLNFFASNRSRDKMTKKDFVKLCAKPTFIHENSLILKQLNNLRANHRHIAIVIDEYAVFLGMITLEDIVEKIVGSIYDEHEEREAVNCDIIAQRNGDLLIQGNVLLFELINQHNLFLDSEDDSDYGTIAGFIIENINRIPSENEEIEIDSHKFVIKKIKNNVIDWVLLKKSDD